MCLYIYTYIYAANESLIITSSSVLLASIFFTLCSIGQLVILNDRKFFPDKSIFLERQNLAGKENRSRPPFLSSTKRGRAQESTLHIQWHGCFYLTRSFYTISAAAISPPQRSFFIGLLSQFFQVVSHLRICRPPSPSPQECHLLRYA